MSRELDVLIVGGGPVGVMTALLLARRGFAVRLDYIAGRHRGLLAALTNKSLRPSAEKACGPATTTSPGIGLPLSESDKRSTLIGGPSPAAGW